MGNSAEILHLDPKRTRRIIGSAFWIFLRHDWPIEQWLINNLIMGPTQILVHVHSWEHRNRRWLADGLNQRFLVCGAGWGVKRNQTKIRHYCWPRKFLASSCKPFVIVPRQLRDKEYCPAALTWTPCIRPIWVIAWVKKNRYVANRKLPRIHLKRKNLLFDCGTPDAVLKNINISQEVKRLWSAGSKLFLRLTAYQRTKECL